MANSVHRRRRWIRMTAPKRDARSRVGRMMVVERFLVQSGGGILASAPVIPGTAAVLSTILYIETPCLGGDCITDGTAAFTVGSITALALSLIVGPVVFRRFARIETANTAAYSDVCLEFERLRTRLEAKRTGTAESLWVEVAESRMSSLKRELGLSDWHEGLVGARWVLANGYATLWRQLHRAQEALIPTLSNAEVVAAATFNETRLRGSTIEGSADLLEKLRRAVVTLSSDGAGYLVDMPKRERDPWYRVLGGGIRSFRRSNEAEDTVRARESEARHVIREVLHSLNEFRDDRVAGLIRARNNLYVTVFVTGLSAHLLLGLALIRNAPTPQITAMSAFYLIGAIVGLFRQLNSASSVDTTKEPDYGLSTARIAHTPLFSGLAAVGGVTLIALLGAVIPAETGSTDIPSLQQIFDLTKNEFGLVGAAAFGLTPRLLIKRLEQQAEQYKDDLRSTAAGESGANVL